MGRNGEKKSTKKRIKRFFGRLFRKKQSATYESLKDERNEPILAKGDPHHVKFKRNHNDDSISVIRKSGVQPNLSHVGYAHDADIKAVRNGNTKNTETENINDPIVKEAELKRLFPLSYEKHIKSNNSNPLNGKRKNKRRGDKTLKKELRLKLEVLQSIPLPKEDLSIYKLSNTHSVDDKQLNLLANRQTSLASDLQEVSYNSAKTKCMDTATMIPTTSRNNTILSENMVDMCMYMGEGVKKETGPSDPKQCAQNLIVLEELIQDENRIPYHLPLHKPASYKNNIDDTLLHILTEQTGMTLCGKINVHCADKDENIAIILSGTDLRSFKTEDVDQYACRSNNMENIAEETEMVSTGHITPASVSESHKNYKVIEKLRKYSGAKKRKRKKEKTKVIYTHDISNEDIHIERKKYITLEEESAEVVEKQQKRTNTGRKARRKSWKVMKTGWKYFKVGLIHYSQGPTQAMSIASMSRQSDSRWRH